MCPTGMFGMLRLGNSGFFSITNCRFGTDSVTMYGPTPGGGEAVMLRNGVSPGTSPTNHWASTFWNEESASVSVIVISPVWSLVSIPEMSASGSFAFRYSSAPTMIS